MHKFKLIIEQMEEQDDNANESFLVKMVGLVHDYSFQLSKQIMEKTQDLGLRPSSLMLNYCMNSAISADETEEMLNLLVLSTVLDERIDLNTYWRYCFRVYDHTMPIVMPSTGMQVDSEQQKALLVKMYTIIQNDHGDAGLQFSTDVIQDYYQSVLNEKKQDKQDFQESHIRDSFFNKTEEEGHKSEQTKRRDMYKKEIKQKKQKLKNQTK